MGSRDKLERAVLVLVGMLMPLVPLFVQILTRTVEVTLLCHVHISHCARNTLSYFLHWPDVLRSTDKLERAVLGLVGMLMPLAWLLFQILTRTVEVTLLCLITL